METQKTNFIITKDNLLQGLNQALGAYQLAALTKKNGRILYDVITDSNDIMLTYHSTVLSPKKFFFPQKETILEYTADGTITAQIVTQPLILFGIRPCDLNGLKILHEAFADDYGDPNYLAKLEQTVVIGIDCNKVCDTDAFCYKVGTQNATSGFDIMLYEIDDGYALTSATPKGADFVTKYFTTSPAQNDEIQKFQAKKSANFSDKQPFKNLDKLPELFAQNRQHKIWQEEGARCLSCGSCVMVCPTCYCFDIKDEWQLNLKKGQRIRSWDACMLDPFAKVSSGENFRGNATARLQHRINRKFNYLMTKHKQPVCVGCGRCVRACLAKISPDKIATVISETATGDET